MSASTAAVSNVNDAVLHINCVYAVSGTYGLLPRLLYYATLIFAIFGRSREWLVIGALVSALTYAGTTAIHVMALATSRREVYDLDIMAGWSVLSTGALAYIGIIHWSSTLRNPQVRLIMICWGILVGIGLIFGRVELFDTSLSDPEPACYSSRGKLLEYPIELISPDFECTYKCFGISKPMRHPSEIVAVPRRTLVNKYLDLAVVLVGPIQFAAYAAISLDSLEHSPSQLCQRAAMKYLFHPRHKAELTKMIYNASMEQWYGGYFTLLALVRRSRWSMTKLIFCSVTFPWLFVALIVDITCLPLMVANIILNEISLQCSKLPVNESNNNIGQWGVWVNSALVVIAACTSKILELRERSKQTRSLESSEQPLTGCDQDVEPGMVDEQVVGVVKPKLAHVQTLRDLDDMNRPGG